jgi:phosphoglycerol transferase MdoB-like AlkP superfamily enzyme
VNLGGLVVLTIIFSILLLVVQRTERKRRFRSIIIMGLVGSVIWNYGLYALNRDCGSDWRLICQSFPVRQSLNAVATQTVWTAVLLAFVLNIVYWALLGRYNPVGSSDAIIVIGRDD